MVINDENWVERPINDLWIRWKAAKLGAGRWRSWEHKDSWGFLETAREFTCLHFMLRILVTVSDCWASSTSSDGDDAISGCSERLTSCGSEKDIPPEAERRGCFLRHPLSRVAAGSTRVTGVVGVTGAMESTVRFWCSLLSLRGRKGDRLSCRFRIPDLRSGTCNVERRDDAPLSSLDLRRRLKNPLDADVPSGAWLDGSLP